jgi:hypothetical protein
MNQQALAYVSATEQVESQNSQAQDSRLKLQWSLK